MNRKILPSVALGVLLLTGCAVPSNIPGNTADMYPDLPDNEYCFRKIADYQCSASNRDNIETTVQITPDGKKKEWRTITPGYTLEGYLGILEGRGAIRKHNIIVSALQSQKIFTSSSKTPDFIVEMTGTWNADPAQYRIFTVYFKPENEARMLEWLEKLIPYSTHLKHAPNTLFIEKNPDCILLEHVSPELIEYAWKTRQGDIGKVEGLEKRMAGAPDELVKYIAQMRKWAEFDKKTPLLFQNAEEWEKFRSLSKTNDPFYAVFNKKSVSGNITKTETDSFLLLLDGNANIVWKYQLESHCVSESNLQLRETISDGEWK